MAITGLRSTDPAKLAAGERPENYREGILINVPNGSAPLTALTAVMASADTDDPVIHWYEKEHPGQRLALAGTITAGTSSWTIIDDGTPTGGADQLTVDMVLFIEQTGELVRVTGNISATTVDVERGFAGTTAAGVTLPGDNPNFVVIGTAFEEGADSPEERSYIAARRTNYTQIFRNTIGATRTAIRTRVRTKPILAEMKRESLLIHTNSMERAWFLGRKSEVMTGTHPRRTCDGLFHYLTDLDPSRIISIGSGTLDMDDLENIFYEAFQRGSDEKMAFIGNKAVRSINETIRKDGSTQYNLKVGESEYGMKVMRLISPYGEIVMRRHPLFNELQGDNTGNTYFGMDSTMAIMDMASVRYRPLKGDDTRYIPDVQTPGKDGDKSEWLTEASIEFNFANRHLWVQHIHRSA